MPRSVQDQALQVMLPLDRPAYQRPSCRFHRAKIMGYAPLLWPFSESVCPASNLYMYGGDHEFLLHHARRPMPCARIYAQWPLQSDRKSTRLNSSHVKISYAVFCLKKKKKNNKQYTTT